MSPNRHITKHNDLPSNVASPILFDPPNDNAVTGGTEILAHSPDSSGDYADFDNTTIQKAGWEGLL